MQERLSVGNVKLLHAGGGLPHVHYFPTKGDESNLIKDENDPAKKSYMRSVVCSKTSLLIMLLLLVALTSYLVFEIPRREDDGIEEISVTEGLPIHHGDSIKYQSIAHNFKLQEKIAYTNALPTEEELSENVTDVVNEKQGDDSINDSISQDDGRVPTEDEAEEVANEIHSATDRLKALMKEWSEESNLNSNLSEEEFDLTKQPSMDNRETTMAFLLFLIEAIKEARGSITVSGKVSPEETYESYGIGDMYPAYNDDYDDEYNQDISSSSSLEKFIRKHLIRENK